MRLIKKTILMLLCVALVSGGVIVQPMKAHALVTPASSSTPVLEGGGGGAGGGGEGGGGQTVFDAVATALHLEYWQARLAAFAKEFKLLADIITIISNIYSMLKEYLGEINEKAETDARLMVLSHKLQAMVRAQLDQFLADTDANNVRMGAMMDLYADYQPPKHEFLCKAVLAHQAANTTEDFELAVSRWVMTSLLEEGTGPREDYDGVLYAAMEEKLRCLAGFGSIVDGYDESCMKEIENNTNINPRKRAYTDADLLPQIFDGAVTLEMPEIESKAIVLDDKTTITVNAPKPANFNQWMWVAGYYYCHQLAGWHPSPPYGEDTTSKPSKSKALAEAYHAKAMHGSMLKSCADLLAHHTRPNKTSGALLAEQNMRCKTMEKIIDDKGYQSKFASCERGLSPYQAQQLTQLMCKSTHYYLAGVQSGATHPEMSDSAIMCSASWDNWMAKEASMQGALVDVVMGIQRGRKNWQGVKSGALSLPEEVERYAGLEDQAEPLKSKKAKPIQASFPSGASPVSADEISWPASVLQ